MPRTSLESFNCSLARTVDIIGDQWTLLILRDAFYGISSFSDFSKRLGLARTVLTDRLNRLVEHEILRKEQTKPGVDRYRYKLTTKGKDLFPVIVSLVNWGDRWIFGADNEPIRIFDKRTQSPVQNVKVQARDGHVLEPHEVTFGPGPGASSETLLAFKKANERLNVIKPD
ncbi:MAG: winged helix-turn-helix transcriptional regulator [Aestuariibacter sp.]